VLIDDVRLFLLTEVSALGNADAVYVLGHPSPYVQEVEATV